MGLQKRVCLSLIGITILIGSCIKLSQPSSKIEHFTLEYDAPQLADRTPLAHVIRVERFSVAPEYNSDRITYRDKSFKRDAYVYYRWRANPGDLITSFLVRDMKHSGLFKAVLSYDSRLPSSFLVEGTVDEFFEFDTEERWEAVLSVGITLMAEHEPESSRKILFQKSFHARHPCARKHPRALAEAMSEAMSAVSKDILETLHSFLKKQTK